MGSDGYAYFSARVGGYVRFRAAVADPVIVGVLALSSVVNARGR